MTDFYLLLLAVAALICTIRNEPTAVAIFLAAMGVMMAIKDLRA